MEILPITKKGFTLFELIAAITLVSILLTAVWAVYSSGFKVFYGQEKRSAIKGEVSRLLIVLSRELRQASSLTAAQQTTLSFNLDTDDNGLDELIRYSWSGVTAAALQRISTYTASVVPAVKSLVFSYYEANNNILSFPVTASQVRLVAIDITAQSADETFQSRFKARLRTL